MFGNKNLQRNIV